ncbi:Phage-related lysozyme (muraminidase) [Klebsiella pneumoniae]|uniref:glycoside hydrolase family 108 protein n=1 Tax=Klebsiella pneumoniae TaxID=573 RepID=UPI0006D9E176|nr:glycosyl hydrolase 108 family protein [Klebsiella pneumoniae]SAX92262.1 Phage-related lysozyme (muraminidase) [Klebsiella pneumoniae]VAO34967.1 Phage-related lysozyme (muraminidase) [Klebsiella pneumoniae]VAP09328.1 Phage-related lysozyme (muraminidase) [Klebsiella pneumoniae]VAP68371.1 Phage-related lysozyme (muraminidase) [Klebsiella pneumoniae]VAR28468.1 Phage-related lysozyme (muraminidase) [Klebsiella pneumoniae]
MTAKLPKISYPVPSNKNGHAFSSAEELLSTLGGESSGLYLVGSQGMWHGGIHITDATIPWCALSTDSEAENEYCRELYKGEQFIRCMADGEIVAWRVSKDYESAAIEWCGEKLFLSTSFVLVKHYIQPGDMEESGLTFFTLYMNLAPYAAYQQQGSLSDRKVAGVQRYYTSAEDVQAEHEAGKLDKYTLVTLSDAIVTRSRDRRQFTEVTIVSETKNAAGDTLVAGTKVWTVSDRGSLKATESAPVPSWWAKCTPAYTTQPEGVVKCTSRTDWAYYLSREDVLHYKKAGRLAAGFPLSYEPGNTAQQVIRPGKEPGEAARTFSLVTLGRDKDTLKKGDRVWVVSDGDSLTSVAPAASSSEPVFNDVYVPSAPVPVSAGDSLGHMGFYQLPEENGKRSRYQVHIECLSTDDMEKFITNPGRVGEDAPVYLTWKADAPLSDKSDTGITAGSRKTKAPGILTLANVPGVDAKGKTLTNNKDAAWFQIRPEGGWLPAASVKKVSQYALGELGFVTLNKASESFDLIDGIKQPNNMVKGILEQLYKAAQDETRTTHALNKYNYKRLLELIDSNQDGYYQEQEYLQAVHNISYRDRLYRVIAKHASEWYYGKDAPLWKTYLDTLTRDAPLWKTYLETFLDKMTWMKTVSEKGVALGSEPWHMHPVVFLEAIRIKERCRELFSKISSVILQHEGGYVNDPNDRGGETNMGITIATWRAYAPSDLGIEATTNTLRNMTKEQAEIIYYNHYWEPKGFCKLETIKIALMLYDWTITSGRAVTQVRKMLHNEYNINLVVSNTMDDDMIHCINAIEDQEQLLSRIAEVRKEYYRSLTITNGEPNTQVRFLTGWINRVNDCLRVNI